MQVFWNAGYAVPRGSPIMPVGSSRIDTATPAAEAPALRDDVTVVDCSENETVDRPGDDVDDPVNDR